MNGGPTKWFDVDWARERKKLAKLQRRQTTAVLNGDRRRARRLRQLIRKSASAKLLAARKVAKENSGARTPGVDEVANLSDESLAALAMSLSSKATGLPNRGIRLLKRTGKSRTIQVPPMRDRAEQELMKLSFQAEMSCQLDPLLIGARKPLPDEDNKTSGIYDAIEMAARWLSEGPVYAGRTDIQDFFPSVPWEKVQEAVHPSSAEASAIHAWMAAPTVLRDGRRLEPKGLSQGSPLSPLLAHAVLKDLHAHALEPFDEADRPMLLVYVDDVLVLGKRPEDVSTVMRRVKRWLEERGLALNGEKSVGLAMEDVLYSAQDPLAEGGFTFLGVRFEHMPENPELVDLGPEGWDSYPPEIVEARQHMKRKSGWELRLTVLQKEGSGYGAVDPAVLARRLRGIAFVTKEGSDFDWY